MRISRRIFLGIGIIVAICGAGFAQLAPPAPAAPGLSNVFNPAPANTFSGNKTSISVAVHGADSNPAAWANGYVTSLAALNAGWDGWAFDWNQDAHVTGFLGPNDINIINAQLQGQYLAHELLVNGYTNIHLYGHSLGGRVIQTASTILSQAATHPTIQTTFLDPYTPYIFSQLYGTTATYSDEIVNTTDWLNTNAYLPNAFVTDVTPARPPTPTGFSAGHSWPYVWYKQTIDNYNAMNPPAAGLGYALSLENGTAANMPARGTVDVLNAANNAVASTLTVPVSKTVFPQNFNPNDVGVYLNKSSDAVQVSNNLIDMQTSNNGNEWINVALNLSSFANFIDFKFNFSSNEGGMLSVQIDGTLIWAGLDTYALTNQWEDTGVLAMLGGTKSTLNPGQHVLSFRLDAGPSDVPAHVQIQDLSTGFLIATPEPGAICVLGIAVGVIVSRRRAIAPRGR